MCMFSDSAILLLEIHDTDTLHKNIKTYLVRVHLLRTGVLFL